jgi:hypothetical protein
MLFRRTKKCRNWFQINHRKSEAEIRGTEDNFFVFLRNFFNHHPDVQKVMEVIDELMGLQGNYGDIDHFLNNIWVSNYEFSRLLEIVEDEAEKNKTGILELKSKFKKYLILDSAGF